MLGRFELLIGFFGSWAVSIIILVINKWKRGNRLPEGSILSENNNIKDLKAPGSRWSKWGVTIGLGTNSFTIISVLILCIFDFWDTLSPFITFPLPIWLNWSGLIAMWIINGLGTSVFIYNVNYTAAYKPIKDKYVLATGGLYRWVRHPIYIIKAVQTILLFLTTGIWLTIFGLIAWFALPTQAKAEEELMEERFGEIYSNYVKKTGRFLPKIKLFQKKSKENNFLNSRSLKIKLKRRK